MKGILVLAHGSRQSETEQTMLQVVSMLKERVDNCVIEHAFLQFSNLTLDCGLDKLVEAGVDDIVVVPYFLFSGVHILEDIPAEIKAYVADKPGLNISMGQTLGADARLADILADRVKAAL